MDGEKIAKKFLLYFRTIRKSKKNLYYTYERLKNPKKFSIILSDDKKIAKSYYYNSGRGKKIRKNYYFTYKRGKKLPTITITLTNGGKNREKLL